MQIKKKCVPKNKYDTKKIRSSEFSSLVSHGICGHLCAGMNVLGLWVHLVYILVYFWAMTLISIELNRDPYIVVLWLVEK